MDIVVYPTCPQTGKSFEEENPIFYVSDNQTVAVDVECPHCGMIHTYEV
jgi:hypothetical protein